MAVGTAVLDFGSTPTDEANVVVTGQAAILSGSHVEAFFMRESTGDNDVDEHEMAGTLIRLVCGSIVAGTGFTIYAQCLGLQAIGTFNVRWAWV